MSRHRSAARHPDVTASAEVLRLLVFAAAVAAVCVAYRLRAASALWLPTALAAVVLAIWHGAYDAVLAERVLPARLGQGWRLPFYAGYVGLAAVVVLFWWLAPAAALVAFLLYSALHFGTEADAAHTALSTLSGTGLGFLPIAAACHWWPAEVAPVFSVMLHGKPAGAAPITVAAGALLWPGLLLALSGVLHRPGLLLRRSALVLLELVLFRFCTPLVAFAIFFCVWHTPEHLVETSRGRQGFFDPGTMARNLRQGLVPWLAAVAMVGLAAWMGRHAVTAYLGTLFIALSALTVPHMALAMIPVPRRSAS